MKRSKKNIQKLASGWGNPQQTGQPANATPPQVNPFLIPKASGLTVYNQSYPQNFLRTWDITNWRMACDQVLRMGLAINYGTMCEWAVTSSLFIQSLIREIEVPISEIPFYLVDSRGNKKEEFQEILTKKSWFRQLCIEIALSQFWGFSGLNFDPITDRCYKYPIRDIDPINQMLRVGTYSYPQGERFADNVNLLYVQPSSSQERFLGWMQPLTRMFIGINQNNNNWLIAGKRNAFPIMSVGYPAVNNSIDQSGNPNNPYKTEAENVLQNVDAQNGLIYNYTLNPDGTVNKSLIVDFEGGNAGGTGAHGIFKDFNDEQKNEAREMIMLSTLTSSSGKTGSLALGQVHENKYQAVISHSVNFVLSVLNTPEVLNKIASFYKGFPQGAKFEVDKTKKYTLEEIEILSKAMNENGYQLTPEFFESTGIPVQFFEKKPEPIQPTKPTITDKIKQTAKTLFNSKKKNPIIYEFDGTLPELPNDFDLSQITENQIKAAYEGQYYILFPEKYKAVNDLFFNAIAKGLQVNIGFQALTNTAFFEQYILNSFQFSAAKNAAEMKELQRLVFDENRKRRTFSEFQTEAEKLLKTYNEIYLRVEYDLASRGSVMAENWQRIWKDRDLQPYAIYRTRGDARVRPEHAILDGKKFLIESPAAKKIYPPNGWNCRCEWDTTDYGDGVLNESETEKLLTGKIKVENRYIDIVAPNFRGNVGIDGIFNLKNTNYSDAMPKNTNPQMFGLRSLNKSINTKVYTDTQIQSFLSDLMEHNTNELYFKNYDYKLIIRVKENDFNEMLKKRAGVENVKESILNPSEIWAQWTSKEQKKVRINWILKGAAKSFISTSEYGTLIDFNLIDNNKLNEYQKGFKLLK